MSYAHVAGRAGSPIADRLNRDIAEWTEDVCMAALCARLPVEVIWQGRSSSMGAAMMHVEVLGFGGAVLARRTWSVFANA